MRSFLYSLQSEWLKTKNSVASWLCIIGGFLVPLIYCINFFRIGQTINGDSDPRAWEIYFHRLWIDMSYFLLPIGVMLAASLIAQVEFRNNTWKQLNVTPQPYSTIFFAKLSVLLLMTFRFFLFFNIGAILSVVIPCLILDHHLPVYTIPWKYFFTVDSHYFLTCLPIIALQFILSIRLKNFLVPIGIGLAGIIVTLISLKWRYIYLSPYSASMLYTSDNALTPIVITNSTIFSILLIMSGYFIYTFQKVKG